jgi:hypothetical protein
MKGHIAFCPHFHQPHFQLYRTREEAFQNSYKPWLQMLAQAVQLDSFFINLHFSGPFLYWLSDTKPEFIDYFNTLLTSGKIGLLGGLADEPFIQLSSRNDDVLYQMKKYDELLSRVTGVTAGEWQGIHLVERECGEMLLYQASQAARAIQAQPIFYLDAETFYASHFTYPGSEEDYCLKHFGFTDPVAKTTISHLPQNLLFFGLRDEINGQEFISVPVHSQFRYQLLKRNQFTNEDRVIIKPEHYYFYVKDALEQAYNQAQSLGKPMEPLLVIFEDAEKFGQWSKDPKGDREWLMEFFALVDKDPDLDFIGLKDYLHTHGYFDTYPASSSHSYPEWENWTARRGIRGVTFGDKRLRKVICRLRDAERLQDKFERAVLNKLDMQINLPEIAPSIQRAIINSPERFQMVEKVLEQYYPDWVEYYRLVNRVRHLVYQEDPKWASRHPNYGSSPFYDMQGLAYLEIAIRVLAEMLRKMNEFNEDTVQYRDWDMDGRNEIVIEHDQHSLVLDRAGGCLVYHHAITPQIADSLDKAGQLLGKDFKRLRAYNQIHRSSYPLVMTESDSDLKQEFYPEGGRQEVPRNSMRCSIWIAMLDQEMAIGNFDTREYTIESIQSKEKMTIVTMRTQATLDLVSYDPITITLRKTFVIDENSLQVVFNAQLNRRVENMRFFMVPELVSSAAPSDEVHFRPCAWLGVIPSKQPGEIPAKVCDVVAIEGESLSYINQEQDLSPFDGLDYLYRLESADGSSYYNRISYRIQKSNPIHRLEIKPAVRNYYHNYVFNEQSSLSYHTSGLMLCPWIPFDEGEALLSILVDWHFDVQGNHEAYEEVLPLIKGCIG